MHIVNICCPRVAPQTHVLTDCRYHSLRGLELAKTPRSTDGHCCMWSVLHALLATGSGGIWRCWWVVRRSNRQGHAVPHGMLHPC